MSDIEMKIQQSSQLVNNKQVQRLYQFWPGKNRFFIDGRFMTGPLVDLAPNICTWITLLGITIPYLVIISPVLYQRVTTIIPIFNGLLLVSAIFSLILTGFTDPGIIPRKIIMELNDMEQYQDFILDENQQQQQQLSLQQSLPPEQLNQQQIYIGGNYQISPEGRQYCLTCQINRPKRASHCRSCDNCVEVWDHHCPFVNNCIGKRNYRYFLSFLISINILAISIIIGFFLYIFEIVYDTDNNNTNSNNDQYLTLILIFSIPIGIIILCLMGLCCFHGYLIITGKTTREKLKKLNKAQQSDPKFNFITLDPVLFDSRQILTNEQLRKLLQGQQGQSDEKDNNLI